MVAQEALHKFKVMKGKKGLVAWKIDLTKAYDKIQWGFIRHVLTEIGVRGILLDLIMWCVTSVQYRVVINGEVSEPFTPGCGIRQGDPLSPYIFVMCMEKLSHLITQKVGFGTWKGVKISTGGPSLSHLFFADDLILFGQATLSQARSMKECLDVFCGLSGQQVSYPKSRVFCSKNVRDSDARLIAGACDSPLTSDLGNYLGVPLIHGRISTKTYDVIVEKTKKCLAAWKCDSLSIAGRATLIKSVTSALPVYAMQSVKLPVEICNKLDKLNRDFLWGHSASKSAAHLVSWDTVCLPKHSGGLGIKKSKAMNQALLAKAGWRLLHNDSGFWSHLLKCKYLRSRSLTDPDLNRNKVCSSTWKAISFGAKLIGKGLRWRVGSGSIIRF